VATAATAGDSGSSSIAAAVADDDLEHTYTAKVKTDELVLKYDSTSGAVDTTADMPNDLDRIDIGSSAGGAAGANGVITEVTIKSAFGGSAKATIW
jgi:hypothetical protein